MADGFKDKDKKFHPTNGKSKGVSKDSVKDNKDTLKTSKKKELKVEDDFDINSKESRQMLEKVIDDETDKRIVDLINDDEAYDNFRLGGKNFCLNYKKYKVLWLTQLSQDI